MPKEKTFETEEEKFQYNLEHSRRRLNKLEKQSKRQVEGSSNWKKTQQQIAKVKDHIERQIWYYENVTLKKEERLQFKNSSHASSFFSDASSEENQEIINNRRN